MPIATLQKGITLYYDEFGSHDGETIVLIQGLKMQCIGYPDALCEKLTRDNTYRVIRFDNRDIGLSHKCDDGKRINILTSLLKFKLGMKVKGPYTLNDMADDVFQLLDALNIETAHFVGCSMGGMIAQICTLHRPDRVMSLTSIMSTTSAKNLPSAKLKLLRKLVKPRPVEEKALKKHSMALMKACTHPNNYDEALLTEFLNDLIARSTYEDGGRQSCAVMMTEPRTHTLKNVTVPTVVIHGAYDALLPVQHGVATHKAIPNSKFVVIEEMGHELPMQHWDQMAAEIHLVAKEGSQKSTKETAQKDTEGTTVETTERSVSVKGNRPDLTSKRPVENRPDLTSKRPVESTSIETDKESRVDDTTESNTTTPKIVISDGDMTHHEGEEYRADMEGGEQSAVAA